MVDIARDSAQLTAAVSLAASSRPIAVPRGAARRFLLLGGPFGPFFRQLAELLETRGARVLRINLHAADAVNWGWRKATRFNRPYGEWPAWLGRYLSDNGVTDLVVYGDCQFYNRTALDVARGLGVRRHVFELGYFRPDWVTYEPDGVNGHSSLPRTAAGILREAATAEPAPHEKIGVIMPWHVAHTMLDYFSDFLGRPAFFRYHWPYLHGPLAQAFGTVTRVLRVQLERGRQKRQIAGLRRDARPYYLCLLQREGDSQILFHSPFGSVAGFYEAVMQDFARHAPAGTLLVFKNHPLDPGVRNHGRQIARMARVLGIEERIRFFDGGNLAELARPARGVITTNSTAGIAAVQFGVPTITLGAAIYDVPGLTHQDGLATFWHDAQRPDPELFRAFHRLVLARTQINGNYYSPRGRRIVLAVCADRLMAAPAAQTEAAQ
ncbi:MAG TPA: capsular biosynthesis protein [Rhizomicrobium sp.]|jgi:capsular polysaccharide export protein|nr:capsular biosynthesis protein [Rhizomicrobium sp.]